MASLEELESEPYTETEQYFSDSMKSAGIPTSESELKAEFERQAEGQGLVFKNNDPMSPWWNFLKSAAISPARWLMQYLIRHVMPNLFVKTATGYFLDLLAWVYELPRKQASKAEGVIKFTRESIGVVLKIPKGTVIQTAPIGGNIYKVISTQDVEFGLNDYVLNVPVIAEKEGLAYNLADGYYIVLPEPITGISSVTNENDWLLVPGDDEEKDDDFRLRIRGHFSTVSDHHVNSVYKSIIAEKAGIKYERIFIDHTLAPRGPGSADAYVLFDVGQPAQTYLDSVNTYIRDEGYHGLGDDMQAKSMPETTHNLNGTVYVPAGLSSDEKDVLLAGVENMTRAAFRENTDFDVTLVWPFKRFSFSRLNGEMYRKFQNLYDLVWNIDAIESNLDVPRIGTFSLTLQEVV